MSCVRNVIKYLKCDSSFKLHYFLKQCEIPNKRVLSLGDSSFNHGPSGLNMCGLTPYYSIEIYIYIYIVYVCELRNLCKYL